MNSGNRPEFILQLCLAQNRVCNQRQIAPVPLTS